MIRPTVFLAALLLCLTSVRSADPPKGPPATRAAPVPLEQKLCGGWKGGPCQGDWTYRPDGTFRARHYSPGGNRLEGTWAVRWDALPPTLARTCKTLDDPDLVGKSWDVKLVQLDDEELAYSYKRDPYPDRFTRLSPSELAEAEDREAAREKELAALQGIWVPLECEEGGKKVEGALTTRHIIKGDHLTVKVDGRTRDEGTVVLDPTQNPKQLYLRMNSGPTHAIIYVRVGDHVIYCGNRQEEPLPTEFESGTAKGGEYLMAWKIEK